MAIIRLLKPNGLPCAISFLPARGKTPHVIRVTGKKGQDTMFTLAGQDVRTVYYRAIDRRLELIGLASDDAARRTLQATFDAFLTHYGLRLVPHTIHVLDLP